jgi:hypothetical protein
LVVKEADDAGEDRGGARSAVNTTRLSGRDDLNVFALRRNVGVASPAGVEETFVGGAEDVEVFRDGVSLVVGDWETMNKGKLREMKWN